MTLAHWDDVEKVRRDFGNIHALWSYLGEAAGSRVVGFGRSLVFSKTGWLPPRWPNFSLKVLPPIARPST